ncbi:MAG: methyltransferase domain-containing protein [Candidatus Bathyarchaeum sp.]|nr:MAG: methyltransferase domain-containing protein [Candidatus Bathyarchaeum sp.]
MLKLIKRQVHGFAYLLLNPSQLKHLILRETRYRFRNKSKRMWVKWQKYDSERAYEALVEALHNTRTRPFNLERIEIISDLIGRLGNGLNILDVGSGDGIIGEHVWKIGNHVIAIDLPTVAIQAHRCQGLLALAGDAEQLSFASNIFDVVLASEILEHLWNPHSFVDEAYRVLKADGHLIISTPEGIDSLRYDAHKYYFTLESLKQMLGARFDLCEVKRLKPAGTATPTIISLFRKSAMPKN